jgi:MFS family permease
MALVALPRTFWLLWTGTLVNRLGSFVVVFLSLYLTRQRGVSVATAGLIVSLYGAGSMMAGLVGGILADRIGRRPTMLVALLGAATAMLALGFAREIWAIAVITPVLGFLADLVRAPVAAMVADVVPPEKRAIAYAYLYWAINLGFSCASLTAGFLARVDYFLLFAADAATTLAYAVLVLVALPETRPPVTAKRERGLGLAGVWADRRFMAFLAITTLLCLVFFQHVSTLPVDMMAHGHDERTFGYVIAVNGVVIVLLQPVLAPVLVRFRRAVVLGSAATLIGIGFGLYALVGTAAWYAAGVAIWTVGEIAIAPTSSAIVAELAPIDARGRYQGAFTMTWGIAFFAGPALGSLILGRAGSVALWTMCLAASLAAAAGFLWLGPRLGRDASHAPLDAQGPSGPTSRGVSGR